MTVTSTSLEAFEEVKKNLGERQTLVYKYLERLGPATNKMLARVIGLEINSVTPRIHELRKKRLVGYDHTDKCRITGRKALYWKVIK